MSSTIAQGEWPLRVGELLGGLPLYDFTQLSALYPFYLWFFPLYDSPIESMQTMHWLTLLHVFIYQVTSYLLLRSLNVSRFAAVCGATLIAFNANSLHYTFWINITAPYSWLPLYLMGLIGVLQGKRKAFYFFAGLIGILLLTTASPAQPLIHALFFTIVSCTVFFVAKIFEKQIMSKLLLAYSGVAGIGLLGILLCAPVLIPAVLGFDEMIRWLGPMGSVVGNQAIPFEAFLFDQLEVRELAGVIFPISGVEVGNQFVGSITFTLAVLAAFSVRKNWVLSIFIIVAVYSLLSAAGSNLGLAYLNYELPFINKIREPSRFLVLFQFSIGVLAAFGLDRFRSILIEKKEGLVAKEYYALILGVALTVGAYIVIKERIVSSVPSMGIVAVLISLSLFTMIVKRLRAERLAKLVRYAWAGAALLLLALDVQWKPNPISASSHHRGDWRIIDSIAGDLNTLDPRHQYRVVFGGGFLPQFASMLSSYHGIRSLTAYFNPMPNSQFRELYYHGRIPDNYHQILGVKYLVCKQCDKESIAGLKLLVKKTAYHIYQYDEALPKTYLAEQLDGKYSDFADFRSKVVNYDLSKPPLFLPDEDYASSRAALLQPSETCEKSDLVYRQNYLRFAVECDVSVMLVVNEYFDGQWTGEINGKMVRPIEVNGNQIGLLVPPGSNEVAFRYQPSFFYYGVILAGIGLILLVVLTIALKVSSKRKKSNPGQASKILADTYSRA